MSNQAISEHAPIYELLVRERGDALAESRKAAEQTHLRARQTLNWSGLDAAAAEERKERAFSAFGRSE